MYSHASDLVISNFASASDRLQTRSGFFVCTNIPLLLQCSIARQDHNIILLLRRQVGCKLWIDAYMFGLMNKLPSYHGRWDGELMFAVSFLGAFARP